MSVANEQIAKTHGFFQDPKRMTWINPDRRMCFSYSVIRDHNDAWLEGRLLEDVPESEFRFHSNRELPLESCMAILEEMKLSHLIPVNRHWIYDTRTLNV
jgi:hypothetical protein